MNEPKKIVIKVPEKTNNEPFVLLWAEKASVELLKKSNITFSEALDGLSGSPVAETFETTGATPESADTTIS